MINAFDTENYPDGVPKTLAAGTLWVWTVAEITAAYDPSAYTVIYRLSLLAVPYTPETFDALKIDGAHVVEVAQTLTAGYTPGEYAWQALIHRDSDGAEVVVDSGFLDVRPDSSSPDCQPVSWVYTTLMAIRATIANTATREMRSYTVNGRQIEARSPEELLALEQEFSKRWQQEQDKADREAGRSSGSRVLVTMRA